MPSEIAASATTTALMVRLAVLSVNDIVPSIPAIHLVAVGWSPSFAVLGSDRRNTHSPGGSAIEKSWSMALIFSTRELTR
jgi:hypothetical protein